jgi:cytochrome c oxidase subunit 3
MPFIQMIDKNLEPSRHQALRFALWIGMGTIAMMFAALTSAYLVRKPVGNWYEFKLPAQFFISTLLILLSSISLEWSYKSFKSGIAKNYKVGMFIAFCLGVAFLYSQIAAWKELTNHGITIDLNVSGSFLYALTGIHAAHVLGGIAVLAASMIISLMTSFEVTKMRILKLDLVRQYWHFVDILWIYLLLFLILQ